MPGAPAATQEAELGYGLRWLLSNMRILSSLLRPSRDRLPSTTLLPLYEHGNSTTRIGRTRRATKRMNGLKAIDPTGKLDLGNGHTIVSYQEQMELVNTNLETITKPARSSTP